VDGRTDGRTDRHFPPLILLGRLLEVDLIITVETSFGCLQFWRLGPLNYFGALNFGVFTG